MLFLFLMGMLFSPVPYYVHLTVLLFFSRPVYTATHVPAVCPAVCPLQLPVRWAVLASLHPADRNPQRKSKYQQHTSSYNWSGIEFPTPITQIQRFERRNANVRVVVYGLERRQEDGRNGYFPFILRWSPKPVDPALRTAFLLYHDGHYWAVRDKSRLLNTGPHSSRNHFCDRCLGRFPSLQRLQQHEQQCQEFDPVVTKMPTTDDPFIRFRQFGLCIHHPFVIYIDFESSLSPEDEDDQNPQARTVILQEHKALAWHAVAVSVVPFDGSISVQYPDGSVRHIKHQWFFGDDCAQKLLEWLQAVKQFTAPAIWAQYTQPMPQLSAQQQADYEAQQLCIYCNRELGDDRVKDHCHLTGTFRGAAHNLCNLDAGIAEKSDRWRKIPIVMHNFKGYDAHLIMQGIGQQVVDQQYRAGNAAVLAQSMEKYKKLSVDGFNFIDSNEIMPGALSSHLSNLPDSDKVILQSLVNNNQQQFALIKDKLYFPYDFVTDLNKLSTVGIPAIEECKNVLTGRDASPAEHQHARSVYGAFGCQNLGDYLWLYLKVDVCGLADVFEAFRRNMHREYHLDPVHFVSAASMSWQAMLRFTGIDLPQLTDQDMYLFFERGIRGGMSAITTRHAKAADGLFDCGQPSTNKRHLLYLDCNGLYGHAMAQPLPIGGFQWKEPGAAGFTRDQNTGHWNLPPVVAGQNWVAEVKLLYPQQLHKLHDDYPAAPYKRAVSFDEISAHSKAVLQANSKKFHSDEKLLATLEERDHYVVHAAALREYVRLGLVVAEVYRVLCFDESPWLQPYVEHNALRRQQAANAFEKDHYKLLTNSIFGKTMENIRRYRDVRLVMSAEKLLRYTRRPQFLRLVRFAGDGDFGAVELRRTVITLTKPIYAGQAILDISKAHMYNFHYSIVKPEFGDSVRLLFTDTDSLAYAVTLTPGQDDTYDTKLPRLKQHLDTSSFPRWHHLYSAENARVPGKFKDELCDGQRLGIMSEYIGLRAKVYCYSVVYLDEEWDAAATQKVVKKAKGIKKDVVKSKLNMDDYRDMIKDVESVGPDMEQQQVVLRSRLHVINTERQKKRALSSYDDKRYVLPCGVHTLAYGNVMLTDGTLQQGCPFCAESYKYDDGTVDPSIPM